MPATHRRAVGPLLLAIILTGCNLPNPAALRPSPAVSGGGSAGPALVAAETSFFGNRYSDAEKNYQAAVAQAPKSVEAHARYALFLNYNHRFPEATAQVGIATGLDKSDALAQAVNTRVHDWAAGSDQKALKDAAAVGAEAIRVGANSALAHAFYSETLADTGDPDKSKIEIEAAARLAKGEYEKAEVERERGNLSNVIGDKAEALTHFKAARDIQPKWAERTRELAGFYFGSGQAEQGVNLLHEAIDMAPDDANLRLYLGGIALQQQNVPVAADALGAANRLKPHDAGVESTLAMTVFTLHHDVGEAEGLLRQAHADAPTNVPIGNLLYGFLRYIKHDDRAAADVRVGVLPVYSGSPLSSATVSVDVNRGLARQTALNTVNDYRAKAKLPPVHLDDHISQGAESHSYWWLFNLSLPESKGLGIHREASGTPGYSGVTMHDRAVHFGFPSNFGMAEVIDHEGTPAAAVSVWIDSVYHRFPLMSPLLDAVGFGESLGGGLPMETMDMSFKNESGDARFMVPYPAEGQSDAPLVFTGNELPDPVPGGYKSPTGYPITVNFNPFGTIVVSGSSLKDGAGADVPFYQLPPTKAEENVLTILPKSPLKPGTTYQVHVTGTISGGGFTKDWSFSTAA
jgi:tetratricopeptide (TPR) repeat protein